MRGIVDVDDVERAVRELREVDVEAPLVVVGAAHDELAARDDVRLGPLLARNAEPDQCTEFDGAGGRPPSSSSPGNSCLRSYRIS